MNSSSSGEIRRSLSPVSVEPEAAALQVGAPAPMFSYLAADGRWHRFEELLTLGAVVVIFAPTHEDLAGVQRYRAALEEIGVRAVPILDLPTRNATALARRVGYTGSVVCDPMSAIAGLYHCIDPLSGSHVTSYFVIDGKRVLRAMYYGPLPTPELLVATAARSLGQPLPSSVFTSTDAR